MTSEASIELSCSPGKLYSLGQIMLATFLGAPLAGSLLVAQNYRVLQKSNAAWLAIACGAVSTIVVLLVSLLLPERFPNSLFPVIYCIAMRQLVSYLQGENIVRHFALGGAKGSWLITIVFGIASLVVLCAFVFATFMLYAMQQ